MGRTLLRGLLSGIVLMVAAVSFSQASATSNRIDELQSTPAGMPGEPRYLADQLGPECDTGVVNYPGRKLGPRNGCDDLSINFLERPFSVDGLTYIPELDLTDVQMGADETWYYWKVMRFPEASQREQTVHLVIELDTDLDGRGDFALEVRPGDLTGSNWQKEGVKLFEDQNNDVGGLKPIMPDGATVKANGYDVQKEMDVWARSSNLGLSVEFALPIAFMGEESPNFGWWAWAVPGEIELHQFDLVDNTSAEALFGVDNTCMMVYGGKPKTDLANQCFKTTQKSGGKGKSGGCVQGAKPSSDSCWIWMPADCQWQCFN